MVEEAVCSAVGHFNDGKITVVHMFGALGIPAGRFTIQACKAEDFTRIRKSEDRSHDSSKTRRKIIRSPKKGFHDDMTAQEGITYEKGSF